MADQAELLARTTEIFEAHVAKNAVAVDQIPGRSATSTRRSRAPVSRNPTSRLPSRSEVGPQGEHRLPGVRQGGKMLKRHLSTAHGLSVIDHRERWGLPADYPMVSPNYAAQRSELAKKIGLGRKPRKRGRKKG